MSATPCPTQLAYSFNDWMFTVALKKMPEAQSAFRAHPKTNEFKQVATHLLLSRQMLANLLELNPEPLPYKNLGEGMEAGFVQAEPYPKLAEVALLWNKLSALFQNRLASVPQSVLDRASPMPIPGKPTATLKDFVMIIALHEAYHIGQLGLMLKAWTGKSGIMSMDNF